MPQRDHHMSLRSYADAVTAGWPDEDLIRSFMHELPRCFHSLPRATREVVLQAAPPLTHSRWDALLAAVTEHVARLHGHGIPDWIDEPERFLDQTWVLTDIDFIRRHAIRYAPGAFIRHGVLPDPRDLDSRGGEQHDWVP